MPPKTDYRAAARARVARSKAYSRRTAGERHRAKYMKKTTKRGAYKPVAKKAMMNRRAPFTETKSIDDILVAGKAGVLAGGSADTLRNPIYPLTILNGTTGSPNTFTILPVQCFSNMERGFEHTDITGDYIFSKYLKAKVEFELPGNEKMIKHPCDVYLIHGWVTLPLGKNLNTTPTQDQLTRAQYNEHIEDQLSQYFNQRQDKLIFRSKRTNNIKILGYRKLKPNNNQNLGAAPTPQIFDRAGGTVSTGGGSPPIVNMACNWPTKRKIYYEDGASSIQNGFPHLYPNFAWLPFMVVYNPTANDFLNTGVYPSGEPQIRVRYNCKHYFSDS